MFGIGPKIGGLGFFVELFEEGFLAGEVKDAPVGAGFWIVFQSSVL
jgi:hypothetical protein